MYLPISSKYSLTIKNWYHNRILYISYMDKQHILIAQFILVKNVNIQLFNIALCIQIFI